MKLRSVLLSAALVFSAVIGFVSAEDAVDENDYRETIYAESGRAAAPGSNSFRQYSELEKGWISLGKGEISESETAALSASLVGDRHSVYDFAVSFDDIDLDGVGFFRPDDTVNTLDTPEADADSSANSLISVNGPYTFLVFEDMTFTNSNSRPQFMLERPRYKAVRKKEGDNKSPYLAPISILFFTILGCILLVLFTSTGINLKE